MKKLGESIHKFNSRLSLSSCRCRRAISRNINRRSLLIIKETIFDTENGS